MADRSGPANTARLIALTSERLENNPAVARWVADGVDAFFLLTSSRERAHNDSASRQSSDAQTTYAALQ